MEIVISVVVLVLVGGLIANAVVREKRRKAARAGEISLLRHAEDVSAIKAIHAGLNDENSDVRDAAAQGLRNVRKMLVGMGRSDPEQLIALLADAQPWVRLEAVNAVGELRDNAYVERLVAILKDTDDAVRVAAQEGLKKIGKSATEPLLNALKDSDPDMRKMFAGTLRGLGVVSHPELIKATNQFVCKISNRGGITLAERIDMINPGSLQDRGLFRSATATLENGLLTLEALDVHGTKVTLLRLPTEQVKTVLHTELGVASQVKARAKKSAIAGFGFGLIISLIAFFRIANAPGPSHDGAPFVLVALLILGVTTGIGYVSGLSKSRVTPMTEFLLSDSQSPLLRFWVDPNQKEAVIQLLKGVGLNLS